MIKTAPHDEFEQMARRLTKLTDELLQGHFGEFCPIGTWQPAVNIYRLERQLEVCMDLAGINPQSVEVHVEPGRLTIRGHRPSPEPDHPHAHMRILAMEIDHGPFSRVVQIPEHVQLARVRTEYVDGMLWIRLPLRDPG